MAKLEAALVEMINDHSQENAQLRQHIENVKKDAIAAATHASALLVDVINAGVQESFVNEKRIELETRALAATVQHYTKQMNKWLTAVRTLDTAIKEIGDFENWMKIMEHDCENICLALHKVEKHESK
eukprot:TRINITY_DN2294_c0_g1_i1.p1 TRINITY_DN2294_c0_g1~~TRINITY_DN2294_c0_g1_i1.p1  ORF type:complete len:128 (+),score=37.90 TRINITY_DN2294_c0_g1_i1:200-583(+)